MATGLAIDDYWLEANVAHDPWAAFGFHSGDAATRHARLLELRASGRLPWFVDEHFAQTFMRPLASFTHAVDFRFWPDAVPFMHFENIFVYTIVVWLAGTLYIELALPRVVVGLATLFYALSGNHAMSVAWVSGRNTCRSSTRWVRAANRSKFGVRPTAASKSRSSEGTSRRRSSAYCAIPRGDRFARATSCNFLACA